MPTSANNRPDSAEVPRISVDDAIDGFSGFDEIVDVRSPAEWQDDHLPGAVNLAVLTNEERHEIGCRYKESSFEAKRAGAAMVSRNIARHLETALSDRPRRYRPLIYCWRGGDRSAAMAEVMRRIGWSPTVLAGGYRAFRQFVIRDLDRLAQGLTYTVVCGVTGSGKSLLLRALHARGGQVVDLEHLACHRGSLLGMEPHGPQPSQKAFETLLWEALAKLDSEKRVFIESESRKIGQLQIPTALLERMRQSSCLELVPDSASRVGFLLAEYGHFLKEPSLLTGQLEKLLPVVGHDRLDEWRSLIAKGHWEELVGRLLLEHYDPLYGRSMAKNYIRYGQAKRIPSHAQALSDEGLDAIIGRL